MISIEIPSNTENVSFSCKNCFKKDDNLEFTLEEFKKVRSLCKANFWYQEVKHLPEIKKRMAELYEEANIIREDAFINNYYGGTPEYTDTGLALIDNKMYELKFFEIGGGYSTYRRWI